MKTTKALFIALSILLASPAIAGAQTVEITDDGNGKQTAVATLKAKADIGTTLRFCQPTPRYYAVTEAQKAAAINDVYETILATADESTANGAYGDGVLTVTSTTALKKRKRKCKRNKLDGSIKIDRVDIVREVFFAAAVLSFTDGPQYSETVSNLVIGCVFCPPPPAPSSPDPTPTPAWTPPDSTTSVGTTETRQQNRQDVCVLNDCSAEQDWRLAGACQVANERIANDCNIVQPEHPVASYTRNHRDIGSASLEAMIGIDYHSVYNNDGLTLPNTTGEFYPEYGPDMFIFKYSPTFYGF